MSLVYLDASALVKLVVAEPESDALMEFLRARPDRVSSALSLVEVPRALRRARFGSPERQRARRLLARLALVDVDRRILGAAAAFESPELRTLDAIHLATALAVREDLSELVTYDRRLAMAAGRADVEVLSPS
ncbi:MAG: type II toxin-antitoxin system VapC family toxin [Candidatus Rokuibacteriota bacterium]